MKERSAAQEHFIDFCRLLEEPTPVDADPNGDYYCFERGARKDSGGDGWADVWKRHCFAWEYKGKHGNLDKAFDQLRQYALALENPPLLIVSDMVRFRIRTNWTNSVSATHEFTLDDLYSATVREKLKWAISDPERLRPTESRQSLTERAASTFAEVAQSLRERNHDPQAVAHFINRIVFCMFAEDVGLLQNKLFTRMLNQAKSQPDQFTTYAHDLFGAMSSGGRIGFEAVDWFNGGLFDDDTALPLTKVEIEKTLKAASLDWSEIDPSIFGTLFERGLDPEKRSQLGAHYTDRDKIMQIIEPVIIRPLLSEWEAEKLRIIDALEQAKATKSKAVQTRRNKLADHLLRAFLERLRIFSVLDPACGSGNFLYLALQALKDFEHRVQLEAEALGLPRAFPAVGPANVKGIEINSYAAELARVSIWIGEIQWMRRNGFTASRDPILKPLETIECRDAILTKDSKEPEWPQADVVIGNPPFLGNRKLRRELGQEYTDMLPRVYSGLVRGKPDLVCYWFAKAGKLLSNRKIRAFGLVATNSIRGGTNRTVLDGILEHSKVFDAWSDEPWVVDSTAVRVSLICCVAEDTKVDQFLNGTEVKQINSDLTAGTLDLTCAGQLKRNKRIAFQGDIKRGPFNVSEDKARNWIGLPSNPNKCPNSDVLKPWVNGMDITRRPSDKWIIDFGDIMSESEAAMYEAPFEFIENNVKPIRQKCREKTAREFWFRHWNPRPAMWKALDGLSRYIVTPRVAKHRLFVWLDRSICPDSAVIAIARDDDTTFGILHSKFHEIWSLRLGTWIGKGNDPRYTPTTTFESFSFPHGLSPDIPAADYADDPRAIDIAEAARNLIELRNRWLNPPEWVEWLEAPIHGFPKRPVARNATAADELAKRTLTRLYNNKPRWLAEAHMILDNAVAVAYGWNTDISDNEALRKLLKLNLKQTRIAPYSNCVNSNNVHSTQNSEVEEQLLV